jgi:hypothetical protein
MERRFLTLAQAGDYVGGRSPRWARRHLLPNVPFIDIPGSGALFDVRDIDAFLESHRKKPVSVTTVVARIMGPVGGKRGTR